MDEQKQNELTSQIFLRDMEKTSSKWKAPIRFDPRSSFATFSRVIHCRGRYDNVITRNEECHDNVAQDPGQRRRQAHNIRSTTSLTHRFC